MKKSELAKDIVFNEPIKIFAIFFFNLKYMSMILTVLLAHLLIIDLGIWGEFDSFSDVLGPLTSRSRVGLWPQGIDSVPK